MTRTVLAIPVGVLAAAALSGVLESVGHSVWPPPPDLDLSKPETAAVLISRLPLGAVLSVLVAWAVGAALGSLLASLVYARPAWWPGAAVGFVMFAFAAGTMATIPHPLWFMALAPFATLGVGVAVGFGWSSGSATPRSASGGSVRPRLTQR